MYEGRDRRAEEEGGGRRADECLALAGPPGGHRAPQVLQGAVARLHLPDRPLHHRAQGGLVGGRPVGPGSVGALRGGAVVHSSLPSVRVVRVVHVVRVVRVLPLFPPGRSGGRAVPVAGVRSCVIPVTGVGTRAVPVEGSPPRVMPVTGVRTRVMPVTGVGTRIVPVAGVRSRVVAVAHAGASMATLSAAIPREP